MATEIDDEIVIRSEDDAWNCLQSALDGLFDDPAPPVLRFEGWPRLQIKLELPDSTITPSIMEGLVELQQAIYRGHAIIYHGTSDLRSLSVEERIGLEFVVVVTAGSSLLNLDAQKTVNELITAIKDKMQPNHWIILVLGDSLLWFGHASWNDYLDHRVDIRKEEIKSKEKRGLLEGLRFLSEQETKRMEIFGRALQEAGELPRVEERAEDGRRAILKSIPESIGLTIGNAELHGSQARELAKSARQRSEPVMITGTFMILRVDTTVPDGFRVRLQNVDDGSLLTAGVQDIMISEAQRQIIQEAEWAKSPIQAEIDAKLRGDQVVDAVIKAVEHVEREDKIC